MAIDDTLNDNNNDNVSVSNFISSILSTTIKFYNFGSDNVINPWAYQIHFAARFIRTSQEDNISST